MRCAVVDLAREPLSGHATQPDHMGIDLCTEQYYIWAAMEDRQCAIFKHPGEYRTCLQYRGQGTARGRLCAVHHRQASRGSLPEEGAENAVAHQCSREHTPINLKSLLVAVPRHTEACPVPASCPKHVWHNGVPIHAAADRHAVDSCFKAIRQGANRLNPGRFDISHFDTLLTLGTGAFGRVKLARCRASGKYCVLKILDKFNIIRLKQVEHTKSERAVLASIKHPFVVELYATFQDLYKLYFVLEFVQGGELFFLLRDHGRLSEIMARFYASEVVCALEYLHSRSIVYRDLKPENVLITRTGHIKLADFGFSKYVHDATWTLCGTPDYLAPEILLNMPYGKTVDWWALGVLLYEMLTGRPPFHDEDLIKLYEKILTCRVSYPQYLSPSAAAIVGHLIEPDLTKRYGNLRNGADDIKSDRWFQDIDWDLANQAKLRPPHIPNTSSDYDTSNFDRYDEHSSEDNLGRIVPEDLNALFKDF